MIIASLRTGPSCWFYLKLRERFIFLYTIKCYIYTFIYFIKFEKFGVNFSSNNPPLCLSSLPGTPPMHWWSAQWCSPDPLESLYPLTNSVLSSLTLNNLCCSTFTFTIFCLPKYTFQTFQSVFHFGYNICTSKIFLFQFNLCFVDIFFCSYIIAWYSPYLPLVLSMSWRPLKSLCLIYLPSDFSEIVSINLPCPRTHTYTYLEWAMLSYSFVFRVVLFFLIERWAFESNTVTIPEGRFLYP